MPSLWELGLTSLVPLSVPEVGLSREMAKGDGRGGLGITLFDHHTVSPSSSICFELDRGGRGRALSSCCPLKGKGHLGGEA